MRSLICAAAILTSTIVTKRRPAGKAPVTGSQSSRGYHIRERRNILGRDLARSFRGAPGRRNRAASRVCTRRSAYRAVGFGLLRLSPAVGALSTAIFLAHHPIRTRAGHRMFAAVIVFGVATVAFALSRNVWLSMGILCVLGAADVTSVVVRSSLVQLETPDEMRGRVSAVNSLFIGTSNQLGEFESGVTASWFGLIPATILGGVGSIVIAMIWMVLFPDLRKLKSIAGSFSRREARGSEVSCL